MSLMSNEVFSEVEEIGFRAKAARLSRGLGVSSTHKGTMTHVAYVRSEEGRGSLKNLVAVCDLLSLSVNVLYKDADGVSKVIDLSELREAIVDYRAKVGATLSEVSKKMDVPYASVMVFESSQRPQVQSIGRYIRALGMKVSFSVVDAHGEHIIPTKRLAPTVANHLIKDLEKTLAIEKKKTFSTQIGSDIKKVREKKNMTKAEVSRLSGISEASVAKTEQSSSTLLTSQKVVESLGKKLEIVVDDVSVPADEIQVVLDQMRESRNITVSEFARTIGTTYRTVKIFPNTVPTSSSLQRYADGLGVKVSHKIS